MFSNFVSPQTCAHKNFLWCRWGSKRRVKCVQTRERGPPSAPVEIFNNITKLEVPWQRSKASAWSARALLSFTYHPLCFPLLLSPTLFCTRRETTVGQCQVMPRQYRECYNISIIMYYIILSLINVSLSLMSQGPIGVLAPGFAHGCVCVCGRKCFAPSPLSGIAMKKLEWAKLASKHLQLCSSRAENKLENLEKMDDDIHGRKPKWKMS